MARRWRDPSGLDDQQLVERVGLDVVRREPGPGQHVKQQQPRRPRHVPKPVGRRPHRRWRVYDKIGSVDYHCDLSLANIRLSQTWACDFFIIVSLRFRVLYGFVILALERREIVHVGVTEHPTAEWVAQRVVETIGERVSPRFLLHDRDSIYGEAFRRRMSGLGVRELVTPPRAPTANAYCERVVGTLRRDCLDHVLVWDERQAERLLREYVCYYDGRPHRGLRLQPPAGQNWLPPAWPPPTASICAIPVLGGLHHRYGTALASTRLVG
jgi:transposase InsO family protein